MKDALQALVTEMEYVLTCINAHKVPFDGDDFHEALRLGKEALAQPEQPSCKHTKTITRADSDGNPIETTCGECGETGMAQPEQEHVADREVLRLADAIELRVENKAERMVIADRLRKLAYTTPPQRKPLTDEHCTWKQQDDIHMPDTWEADCGAMWTFTEGGPKDNDMHYCPKCGKPAIEAAHGIKGNA